MNRALYPMHEHSAPGPAEAVRIPANGYFPGNPWQNMQNIPESGRKIVQHDTCIFIHIGRIIHTSSNNKRFWEVHTMAKNKKDIKKIVLAYSGGLDTSIIIP